MSQDLNPSNAAIRADQLPPSWVGTVAAIIERETLAVRPAGDRIEIYSDRSGQWHPLSPVFATAADRDEVFRRLTNSTR